ncbi:MAG: hypothetical protein AAF385_12955 [Pseudomonadota bacterium]
MIRTVLVIASFLLAACAAAGVASDASVKPTKSSDSRDALMAAWERKGKRLSFIDSHDHNKDGRVSSIEFEQSRRDRFDQTDSNNDRLVDEQEYAFEWEDRMNTQLDIDRNARMGQTFVRFDAMDKDDDERMSWDEYAASGDRIFTGRDTNEDNVIDALDPPAVNRWTPKPESELTADELKRRQEWQIGSARALLEMPTTHNLAGVFARYDLNGDERVERAEFDGKRRADYNATDFDKDGTLTASEYAGEFEDRMDTVIANYRESSIKQSRRRFQSLDANDDAVMTFTEYQDSGRRILARHDVTQDGYVDSDDPLADPIDRGQDQQIATNTNTR